MCIAIPFGRAAPFIHTPSSTILYYLTYTKFIHSLEHDDEAHIETRKALNYENIPLIAPSAIQKLLPSVGVVQK